MVYRVAGGIFFILAAVSAFGIAAIPEWAIALAALIAGIALLAGK